MPPIAARTRDERGQALAELAIVLPVLAGLLLGILQFGIAFNHYLSLTDAVRAGARTAAVSRHLGASEAVAATKTAVKDATSDITLTDAQVSVTSSWTQGSQVTVTATYPYSISIFGLPVKTGNLTSTTKERVE
ncbi:MAG: TadE/TadG family type IV pilus assembly protein [Gaiellaceae bacterium]